MSIHDVMPRTLDNAERIAGELESVDIHKVTLLVVPDSGWAKDSLARLNTLVDSGVELAGHGWRHAVEHVRGIKHGLHSLLISTDVAEHLALPRSDIMTLMRRCHDWFEANGLSAPELYVPPAWAMGDVRRSDLDQLPFCRYETLGGIYDVGTATFRRIAMVGFEADTAFRAAACRAWNRLNLTLAGTSRPIRVAIHPQDFNLRLAGDLHGLLRQGGRALSYRDLEYP